MRLPTHRFAAALLSVAPVLRGVAAADPTITDIFNVGTNCGSHLTSLNDWLNDSRAMLRASNAGWSEFATDTGVRKLGTTFFGYKGKVMPGRAFEFMTDNLALLTGNSGRAADEKPWLFCGPNFMTRKDASDDAFDKNGNTIDKPGGPPGVKYSIGEMYPAELAGGDPYWVAEMGIYTFEHDENLATAYCNDADNLGLTWEATMPSTANTQIMMLCPSAWTAPGNNARLSDAMDIFEDEDLTEHQPRAMTFLHEVYHVTAGGDMLSGKPEIYLLAHVINAGRHDNTKARKNPESRPTPCFVLPQLFNSG